MKAEHCSSQPNKEIGPFPLAAKVPAQSAPLLWQPTPALISLLVNDRFPARGKATEGRSSRALQTVPGCRCWESDLPVPPTGSQLPQGVLSPGIHQKQGRTTALCLPRENSAGTPASQRPVCTTCLPLEVLRHCRSRSRAQHSKRATAISQPRLSLPP